MNTSSSTGDMPLGPMPAMSSVKRGRPAKREQHGTVTTTTPSAVASGMVVPSHKPSGKEGAKIAASTKPKGPQQLPSRGMRRGM